MPVLVQSAPISETHNRDEPAGLSQATRETSAHDVILSAESAGKYDPGIPSRYSVHSAGKTRTRSAQQRTSEIIILLFQTHGHSSLPINTNTESERRGHGGRRLGRGYRVRVEATQPRWRLGRGYRVRGSLSRGYRAARAPGQSLLYAETARVLTDLEPDI